MKKLLLTMACAGAVTVSAFAQLLDEKNVTITMDLQPVLQLNLQGPDQLDFTFDNIASYYSGITKYGANVLKVSSSVSFDLWAAGLSTTADFVWDNPVSYQNSAFANSVATIPITALELRQFPENPVAAGVAPACPQFVDAALGSDYRSAFAQYNIASNNFTALGVNNCIYTASNATPYAPPITTAVAASTEKYIAGATTLVLGEGCAVVGGSYLMEGLAAGIPAATGYYFVMDYRILPGLPAVFPAHENTLQTNPGNTGATYIVDAEGADGGLGDVAASLAYAAPGVYTMYIKYVLVEDQ